MDLGQAQWRHAEKARTSVRPRVLGDSGLRLEMFQYLAHPLAHPQRPVIRVPHVGDPVAYKPGPFAVRQTPVTQGRLGRITAEAKLFPTRLAWNSELIWASPGPEWFKMRKWILKDIM